jgi:PAS domain S-box-containing protein
MASTSGLYRLLIVDSEPQRLANLLAPPSANVPGSAESLPDVASAGGMVFEVETSVSAEDAIRHLEQGLMRGNPFPVAFVNERLGEAHTGAEVVRQLWEYQPDLQIVFCVDSGVDVTEVMARFDQPGNLLVLQMPTSAAEARQAARFLALKWEQFGEFCHRLQELNRVLDQRAAKLQAANQRLEKEVLERQAAEARFAAAFRSSPCALAILAVDDGRVVDANDRFFSLLGVHSQSVLGADLSGFPALDDCVSWASARALMPHSRRITDIECRFQPAPDQVRHVMLSAEVIDIQATQYVLLTAVDLTETRRMEQQVQQVQKMEAVGQLASGVAHDFNNLLTVIQGQAAMLADGLAGDLIAESAVKQITETTERAASLTRKLLTFSRRSKSRRRPLDVNQHLRSLGDMVRQLSGERVQAQLDLDENLPAIHGDPGSLEHALVNLVTNARDAMGVTGGTLTVRTYGLDLSAEEASLRHASARAGSFVVIEVADTGTGMDPRTVARIFEPFFTTKAPGQGSGLGLTVTEGIVQQHDGWIEIDSAQGRGTAVRLLVPALEVGVPRQSGSDRKPVRMEHATATVLLVEDEEPLRRFTRTVLEKMGCRVHEAADSTRALELWSELSGEVDLLLTDMMLPGGHTGDQLASEMRRARPDLQVIFTSGYGAAVMDEVPGTHSDAAFLAKPFSIRSLSDAVRGCLEPDKPAVIAAASN